MAVAATASGLGLLSSSLFGQPEYQQTESVPYNSTNGPRVVFDAGTNINLTNDTATLEQGRVELQTTAGNITFVSTVDTNATITASNLSTGTFINVTDLDVTSGELSIRPEGYQRLAISGDVDSLAYRNITVDDGTTDIVYAGSTGTTTINSTALPANEVIALVDTNTNTVLDVSTTNSTGFASWTVPNSEHIVEAQTSDGPPQLSNAQPNGDVSSPPSSFSVDLKDNDFPQDNVTVKFYQNGTLIDTKYATSAGEISTTNLSAFKGGENPWSVVATDAYGQKDVINASVGLPGTLTIRNETNASEIIDDTTIDITFYIGDQVITNTTTTGTLDMTGIPVNEVIVEIDPRGNYTKRTYSLASIIGDQNAYVFNTSYNTIETRFTLEDPTGEFTSGTILYITKAITLNNETSYRVIHSDEFGVEGVTVTLEEGQRYKVSVRSPSGTFQELGPYRSDVSETVTVRPGAPAVQLNTSVKTYTSGVEIKNNSLFIRYLDNQNLTDSITIVIYEKGNPSNLLRPNETYFTNDLQVKEPLTPNESNKTWVVLYQVDRGGEEFTIRREASKRQDITPGLSSEWRLIVGVGLLIISASIFSVLNKGVGAIVVSIEGGILWWTGWLSGATTAAAVTVALFVSIVAYAYQSQQV